MLKLEEFEITEDGLVVFILGACLIYIFKPEQILAT
jgi:hypothetical protein